MAYTPLVFTSSPGTIFSQIGNLGYLLKQCQSYQGTLQNNLINLTNGSVTQFVAMSDIQALIGSNYINQVNSPGSTLGGLITNIAIQALNRQIFLSNSRISQTLQSLNTVTSLQELIRQMKVAGATVLQMTVSATLPTGSNGGSFTGIGNGIINYSLKRPSDGLLLENIFPELLQFVCTQDSYTGGATAGNEGFTITGQGSETNQFAYDWPLGSNCQITLNAINGDASNSSGNILTNSGFTTASTGNANFPANWVLTVGTPGTNIFLNSGIIYTAGNSLQLLGDGSTLININQPFNNSTTGTGGILNPLAQYSLNLFMRRDGTTVSAGVLTVDLVDQNNVVIQDQNGVANTVSFNLNTLSTNWASFTGIFRTPQVLPTNQFLRMRLTTAINSGASCYIDKSSLGFASSCYVSGPWVVVHSGSIPFVSSDYASVLISNAFAGGGNQGTFQCLFNKLFSMQQNDLLLPSSASSPTIVDSSYFVV